MKDFNDVMANMSKEELDMAIKEQDNETLKVLVKAVVENQKAMDAQDKLITALEKTLYQVVEVFQHNKKSTAAKLEVLATSLDRIEVQLGNRREGTRDKPNLDTQLQDLVDEASRQVVSHGIIPDSEPVKQRDKDIVFDMEVKEDNDERD